MPRYFMMFVTLQAVVNLEHLIFQSLQAEMDKEGRTPIHGMTTKCFGM